MDKYQKLVMQHAYWSDIIKELKKKGGLEWEKCLGVDTGRSMIGDKPFIDEAWEQMYQLKKPNNRVHCIQNAIDWVKDSHAEGDYSETFETAFHEADAEGLVCPHCHEARRLKSERIKAIAHLGAVRGAMTKMGRKLLEEG